MIGMSGFIKSVPKGTATAYLHSIRHQIAAQIGKWAILKERDGRNISVFLIRILGADRGEYQCWDDDGDCRGFITKTIDTVAIMTNDAHLVFLDTV